MSKIKRALISVSDKNGIIDFAKDLIELGVEIISTGGTYSVLSKSGLKVKDVSSITGFPEILDGRVKTLHPKVHGGLLGKRNNEEHKKLMKEHDIQNIDLLIVNLYPFEETILNKSNYETCIENIDIGGPTMLRAAAKNHNRVTVVTEPKDYAAIVKEISENNQTSIKTRRKLAIKVFQKISEYDSMIHHYLMSRENVEESTLPSKINITLEKINDLRYGENPHQKANFFGHIDDLLDQIHGKEISYNNILDIDAAVQLMLEFLNEEPTFAILKHNNACGFATRSTLLQAYEDALAGDPVSAFGGVLICNRSIDIATANKINTLFCEVVIAPSFDADALEVLKSKKNRVLLIQKSNVILQNSIRTCLNGYLVQDKDLMTDRKENLTIATTSSPSNKQISDLIFASKICKHIKSNTIVLVKNNQLLASGTGQTSRVDALKQAIEKAKGFGFDLQDCVMASDAFFPFPDCVEIAFNAGVRSVIQPGGSIKDQLSVDFCDANKMSMVFTGIRHFKH